MSVEREKELQSEANRTIIVGPADAEPARESAAEPAPPPIRGNRYDESMGGVGGGAAGAVGGAIIGSVIGPVGTVLGGMIGAVAGAAAGTVAGKVRADVFGSTEVSYWENHFADRPYYIPGMNFEDYESAYRYGATQCRANAGSDYTDCRDGWAEARGKSRLTWEQAEPAVRDAWRHLSERMNA